MSGRIGFKTKVLLLPAVAAVAFLALVGVNLVLGRENTASLAEIEKGHFPALLASRDLVDALEKIQRGYQDAAAAQDAEALKRIEPLRADFLRHIDELGATVGGRADVAGLKAAFTRYVEVAEATTKKLVAEVQGEDVGEAIERLRGEYLSLQQRLKELTLERETQMAAAFGAARQTGVSATRANVTIAIACLLLLVVMSVWILRNVMRTLAEATGFVSAAAAEILAVAKQTEANAADEAAFVDETRRAMDGLVESASAIAGSASQVLERAEQSAAASRTIAARIAELNAQALRITDISDVIRGIADKSDILALNASLEGSKAGEAGRGFALVGAEMRRLAETVMGAVKQIKQLANEMREVSQAAVLATEEGQKLAAETTQTSKQITLITSQQRTATQQVTQSVNEIQQFTRQAMGGAKQARSAAGDLVRTTTQLSTLLGTRASAPPDGAPAGPHPQPGSPQA
jgi:methyl-accepting chemotaxis protein